MSTDTNRISELAARSRDKNIFVYTDFLNGQAQCELKNAYPQGFVSFWGGADFAERKIARFGNAEDVGYEEDFPLCTVKIEANGGKFAAEMGHRDVLGALMSLGIVRDKVGDIFVMEHRCFAVLHQSVASFVLQNLTTVGKNFVSVTEEKTIAPEFAPKTKQLKFSAASNRLDAVVCKIFNLSREKACELAETGKIFVDGVVTEKISYRLKAGEAVSVRGCGKFVFIGEDGFSKKGKPCFVVNVFV